MSLLMSLGRISRRFPPNRVSSRLGRIFTRLCVRPATNSIGEVKMQDGTRMILDARSRTESGAFWTGERDSGDIDFLKVCASFGTTGLDIGANVGLIAVPLARYLRDQGGGKIVAFEPVVANYERLKTIAELNGVTAYLFPHNVALGDVEGEIEMAHETLYGNVTGNAVQTNVLTDTTGYSLSMVRVVPLDSFAQEIGLEQVDFIKIDIEGAELLCLRGAQNLLQRCRPIIYGEFNSSSMPAFGHTFLDVAALIAPWDYKIFAFVGRLKLVEILEPQVGMGNAVLVPSEKSDELLRRIELAR